MFGQVRSSPATARTPGTSSLRARTTTASAAATAIYRRCVLVIDA